MALDYQDDNNIMLGQDVFWTPPPCDRHPAICVDVVPVGIEEGEFTDKKTGKTVQTKSHKVWLVFQVFPEDGSRDDGKPFHIDNKFTASLAPAAMLRLKLERWRGREFTPDELKQFNLANLRGVPCWLSLIPNGNFVNVSDIEPYVDENNQPLPAPKAEMEHYQRRTYKPKESKSASQTTTSNPHGGDSNGGANKSTWVPF